MSEFMNPKYISLKEYTPGEQPKGTKFIKLNTNESPYPPSPEVIKAVSSDVVASLKLYPDPDCSELRDSLAEFYNTGSENIFITNGSDDILNFAFMAFGHKGAVFPDITYGFYKVFCELHTISYKEIPLNEDFSISPKEYYNAGRMVVIANPNAPTGLDLPLCEIEKIVESNKDNVVVIDEAYVDFGGETAIPLTRKYDNLIVVRTYSKSRSMAGARLGFSVASEKLTKDLNKLKFSTNPYNINRMTMAAGIAALKSHEYFKEKNEMTINIRECTTKRLEELGFYVIPSKANFIFVKHKRISGEKYYNELKNKGILVRHFNGARICEFNRVTIGTEDEMKIFLEKTKEILENENI